MPESLPNQQGAARTLRVAIVGAESTGKTTLAHALAQRLAADTGLRTTWVPEHLRAWCSERGRTPRPGEQPAIARELVTACDRFAETGAFD